MENIPHRPAIDIGTSRGITERDPFAFVAGDRGCDALVFVILDVSTYELPRYIALATEHPTLDSTLGVLDVNLIGGSW